MSAIFDVRDLTVRYRDTAQAALRAVSTSVPKGCFFVLIGPNGSGKSTLIRAMLGSIEAESGSILYEQRPLQEWSRRSLALHVGAVAQLEEMPFPITVRELVAMGRYPHIGALRAERDSDRAAIENAMARCDVAALADRAVATLSGGERQRARIARALAQEPETLVLDEPTVALDIHHEMAVFELLRSLTRADGRTVIAATHNINLAARYADRLLLLSHGSVVMEGDPHSVITQEVLQPVYDWPLLVHQHAGAGFDTGAPQVAPLSQTFSDKRA